MVQAIILSGGKGTRLKPLTDNTPKPMLEIGGKPHLEHIIKSLCKQGITDIIFSTGYLHEQISDYFGDGSKFGAKIQYKEDGDKALGTGGAVANCLDLVTSDTLLIVNGDILTDMYYDFMIECHNQRKKTGPNITIGLVPVEDPSSYGVAVVEKELITKFVEKPTTLEYGNWINSGVYVMDAEVLETIPQDMYIMLETATFPLYASIDSLYAHTFTGYYWLDIGTHERYNKANDDFANGVILI